MIVKLGEIFELQMGKTPSRSNYDYWNPSEFDWVSISDLNNYKKYVGETKEKISVLGVKESGIKEVPSNTVIMSFKLSLGKTAITIKPIYTNEAIMAFIDKKMQKIDTNFIYHLFSGKDWSINTNRAVMGMTLNKDTLLNVQILLPSLEEQQKIANILDKVSNLVTLRKQQLEKLDLLVKSRFIEMFGDPIINNFNWEIVKLMELGEWQSGGTPSRCKTSYFIGTINWYSAGELNELYLHGSIEKITEKAIEESSAKLFKKNSMLIGMYDTAAFKMGILLEDSSSNQACANINPNCKINIVWLYYNLIQMKVYFLNNRRGIRQKNLNLGMIKNFEIPVPPIELQNEFANFVQQVEKQKTTFQQGLHKLELLKKALMQQYFG